MGGGVGEVHKPTPTPQDPCTWAREQEEWPGPVKFIAGPGHSTSYIKKVLSGGEGEPCSPLLSPQTPQIGESGRCLCGPGSVKFISGPRPALPHTFIGG